MTYSLDVYLRFYEFMAGSDYWFAWFAIICIIGCCIGFSWDSETKYSRLFLYYYIVFIVVSGSVRVVAWILLPSPEYLGVQ